MSQTYAEQTNFPKLYSEVYWGNFRQKIDPVIRENRNRFPKEYPVKNAKSHPLYFRKLLYERSWSIAKILENKELTSINPLGHMECYKTPIGWLVVVSPYGITEEKEKIIIEHGFTKIDPLYSAEAVSFVFSISGKPHKRY
jgi:hypothetical protein